MMVSKWGNSLAVRLPKELVETLGLAEGDQIELAAIDHRTVSVARRDDEKAFIEKVRALQKPLPPGFRWNRDEANER